jgi:hypothetical protein
MKNYFEDESDVVADFIINLNIAAATIAVLMTRWIEYESLQMMSDRFPDSALGELMLNQYANGNDIYRYMVKRSY